MWASDRETRFSGWVRGGVVVLILSAAGCAGSQTVWERMRRSSDMSNEGVLRTRFAHIGEIEVEGEVYQVAVDRRVLTGMLMPRGQGERLLVFDRELKLVHVLRLYWKGEPLWCEGSKVYLFGMGGAYGVDIDPRLAERMSPEEEMVMGNVIDFSRGVHKPVLTREKKYGSSGGIEDDPWKMD